MDSGDKSSNKAMSAAYKYAAFLMFCIPTEGDNDADQTTHEVKQTPAVSDSILANHLAAIEAADSIEGLQIAFAAAYKACKADHKATTSLMAMKDSRTAVLSQKAAA